MSLRSRLFSLLRPLSSLGSLAAKKIATHKWMLAGAVGLVGLVSTSVWYHVEQIKRLEREKLQCRLTMTEFELESRIATQELLADIRNRKAAEVRRLEQERDKQAQKVLGLREMFDTTVEAFEAELEELAKQQPEIVPWLDTPVPSSLLQD